MSTSGSNNRVTLWIIYLFGQPVAGHNCCCDSMAEETLLPRPGGGKQQERCGDPQVTQSRGRGQVPGVWVSEIGSVKIPTHVKIHFFLLFRFRYKLLNSFLLSTTDISPASQVTKGEMLDACVASRGKQIHRCSAAGARARELDRRQDGEESIQHFLHLIKWHTGLLENLCLFK